MKILVIKHGALGDIVLAFSAFAAIRRSHPDAEITLLTTAPFAEFLARSAWFDRIEIDLRLPFWNLPALLRLRRQLRRLSPPSPRAEPSRVLLRSAQFPSPVSRSQQPTR